MPATTKRQSKAKTKPATGMTPEAAFERGREVLAKRSHTPPDVAELSLTHAVVIDAVTSLLAEGGHAEDVDGLLSVAMSHSRRRSYGPLEDDPAELKKIAIDFICENLSEWRADLAIAWKRNKRRQQTEVAAKTITERLRTNTREQVREGFEDFMTTASFEELALILGVFQMRDSRHHAAEQRDSEIYLAHAFEVELGRDRHYVGVPERMLDQVQKYVAALRAIDDKAAA